MTTTIAEGLRLLAAHSGVVEARLLNTPKARRTPRRSPCAPARLAW
jgi:hypothetical protein